MIKNSNCRRKSRGLKSMFYKQLSGSILQESYPEKLWKKRITFSLRSLFYDKVALYCLATLLKGRLRQKRFLLNFTVIWEYLFCRTLPGDYLSNPILVSWIFFDSFSFLSFFRRAFLGKLVNGCLWYSNIKTCYSKSLVKALYFAGGVL